MPPPGMGLGHPIYQRKEYASPAPYMESLDYITTCREY